MTDFIVHFLILSPLSPLIRSYWSFIFLSFYSKQIPDITDYTMVNRTYRYYEGDVMFPFGFGLSYSNYSYSNLEVVPANATSGTNITVTVDVTNEGPFDGEEVCLS